MKLFILLLTILLMYPCAPAWSNPGNSQSNQAYELQGNTGTQAGDASGRQIVSSPLGDRKGGRRSKRKNRKRRGIRSFKKYSDIVYKNNPDSDSQKLDLYIPESRRKPGARKTGPRPLVIWIHGGGWKGGDKKRGPFPPLANAGIAVASINYRLSNEAHFPAQIQDCEAALDWLQANAVKYGLDPERIGVWGESAGGHLSMLLAATSNSSSFADKEFRKGPEIKAVCDWFGPMDLETILFDERKAKKPPRRSVIAQLLGGPRRDLKRKARLASPTNYISSNMPPVLIMHGERDRVVPLEQSIAISKKLKEMGVDAKLEIVQGGHGIPGFGRGAQQRVVRFFERNL